MNEYQLSKRLQKVGEFVPLNSRLADIGSDHAYLPVHLLLAKKIKYAVAGEVVLGPYESAKKQVQKNKLEKYIAVRLAKGLDAVQIEDQITAITICGMGGALICDILDYGWLEQKIQGHERLILQPNVGGNLVREWLTSHGYLIKTEEIIAENHQIYEIIVAQREKHRIAYSEKECLFGPCLLQKKSTIFYEKWSRELKQKQTILEQLSKAKNNQQKKIIEVEKEIKLIQEVMNHGA